MIAEYEVFAKEAQKMKQKEQSIITKALEVIIDGVLHDSKVESSNKKIQKGVNKVGQIH